MNDSLEAEIEEIVDKQLQDLGFIDLCTRIAQKVVERVQKIDEEHSIIKTELNDIEEKLNLIFSDKKPPDAKLPIVKKDVIVIEEEEEKPLLEKLQELTKSQNAFYSTDFASPAKPQTMLQRDIGGRIKNDPLQGRFETPNKEISSNRSSAYKPTSGLKRTSSGNLIDAINVKNFTSESPKQVSCSNRFSEPPTSITNTQHGKESKTDFSSPINSSKSAHNKASYKSPQQDSTGQEDSLSRKQATPTSNENRQTEVKTPHTESTNYTARTKTRPIAVTGSLNNARQNEKVESTEESSLTTSGFSSMTEETAEVGQALDREANYASDTVDEFYEFKEGDSVLGKPEKSDIWYTAKISRIIVNKYGQKKYHVKFDSGHKMQGTLPGNSLAPIAHPKGSSLTIGSRVVAIRPRDTVDARIQKKYMNLYSSVLAKGEILYGGVVVEKACEENKHRFLVFFDDGFAQYMTEKKMHLVINAAESVWQDVAIHCREFVKEYLEEFPDRPMLKLKAGLCVQTEWNGKWLQARVVAVDCSLVKMLFDIDKRTEWIYRGSTRLEPLYSELGRRDLEALKNKGKKSSKKRKSGSTNSKKVEPYVEDAITKPCFGISRFSKTDPQGLQQIKEWGPVTETSADPPAEEYFSDPEEGPSRSPIKVASDTSRNDPTSTAKRRKMDDSSGHGSDTSTEAWNVDNDLGNNQNLGNKELSNATKYSPSLKNSTTPKGFQRNSSQSSIESAASDSQLLLRNKKQSHLERQLSSQSERLESPSRGAGLSRRKSSSALLSEAHINFGNDTSLKIPITRSRAVTGNSAAQFATSPEVNDMQMTLKKTRRNSSQDRFCADQQTTTKQRLILPRPPQSQLQYWNTPPASGVKMAGSTIALPKISMSPLPRFAVSQLAVAQNMPEDGTNHMLALINLTQSFQKIRGPHQCSLGCLPETHLPEAEKRKHNPLSIPLLLGWTRETAKRRPGYHRDIYYRAPCSRRLRNLAEVTNCLLQTSAANVTIDQFSFDSSVSCRDQIPIFKMPRLKIDDISNGMEKTPISCVNERNDEFPPNVEYISERIIGLGIDTSHDSGFLASCDCKDNCQDRGKCACARLTIDSSDAIDGKRNEHCGYQYRRLRECVTTGIYECNRNCSCAATCYNRVVQNGIGVRLQVFMTDHKGWGLRCLDDIPRGTFICTYSGQILNEEMADKEGKDFGDEYLAELDHIEIVEHAKEGYESDVPELREEKKTERSLSIESSNKGYDSDSDVSEFGYSSSSDSSDSFLGRKTSSKELVSSTLLKPERPIPNVQDKAISEGVIDLTLESDPENEDGEKLTPGTVKSTSFDQMIRRLKTGFDCGQGATDRLSAMEEQTNQEQAKEQCTGLSRNLKSEDGKPDKNLPSSEHSVTSEDSTQAVHSKKKMEIKNESFCVDVGLSMKVETGNGNFEIATENSGVETENSRIETGISGIEAGNSGIEARNSGIETGSSGIETEHLEISTGTSKLEIGNLELESEKLGIENGKLTIETGTSKVETKSADWNDEVKKAIETIGPKIRKAVARKSTRSILFQRLAEDEKVKLQPYQLENVASNDIHQSFISGKTFTSPRSSTGGHFARKSAQHRIQITPPGQQQQLQNEQQQQPHLSLQDDKEHVKKTTRQLFGEEQCYVIDAKSFGNVGRYLNHSCMPNLFVQNVFHDTQDLRFPLVAFFAQQNIPALTELTWDYSYEVGSVPGKVLQCYCGAIECRGRLL